MRVAVVGTGSIGRRHLGNLIRRGDCEVLAVSEHRRRSALMIDGSAVPVCHRYQEALDQSDVIFICNLSSMHLDYLHAAVAAGRNVFVEKPVALRSAGLDAISAKADAMRLVIAVGTQFRFNRMLLKIRDYLQNGSLGRLLNVFAWSGEHIADYHPDEDYRESYAASRELGGGVLLTQIHQIDYLNWLFGPFDEVTAMEVALPELGVDVETCVSYRMLGAQGVPVTGHLNYLQRPKRTGLQVIGTGGRVEWSYEDNSVMFDPAGGSPREIIREPFDRNEMFIDILDDFFTAIRTNGPVRAGLSDGVEAVRLVEKIKASMRGERRQ